MNIDRFRSGSGRETSPSRHGSKSHARSIESGLKGLNRRFGVVDRQPVGVVTNVGGDDTGDVPSDVGDQQAALESLRRLLGATLVELVAVPGTSRIVLPELRAASPQLSETDIHRLR